MACRAFLLVRGPIALGHFIATCGRGVTRGLPAAIARLEAAA